MNSNNKRPNKGSSIIKDLDSYIVVDIETTGTNPLKDDILEIGALKIINNEIVDTFQSLVKPNNEDFEISLFVESVCGITYEDIKKAPSENEVLQNFINFIGSHVLIGHNIVTFDSNFLYDSIKLNFGIEMSNNLLDTLRVARKCVPDLQSYTLESLSKYFNIVNETQHRALSDCYATNQLYVKLKEDIPYIGMETFGCCHLYMECSDKKECVHPSRLFSESCSYKRNLKHGRIFYGVHRNVD